MYMGLVQLSMTFRFKACSAGIARRPASDTHCSTDVA
jgi:hypothetical protein